MTDYIMRRIQKPSQNPDGWQLLGSQLLAAPAVSMTATCSAIRRRLRAHIFIAGLSGADTVDLLANADAGANYSYRTAENGAADASAVAQNAMPITTLSGTGGHYVVLDIANSPLFVKRFHENDCAGGSAGFAPTHTRITGVWLNTADALSSLKVQTHGGVQTLSAGSKIAIFGSDAG